MGTDDLKPRLEIGYFEIGSEYKKSPRWAQRYDQQHTT